MKKEEIVSGIAALSLIFAGLAYYQSIISTNESKQYYDTANKLANQANKLANESLALAQLQNFHPVVFFPNIKTTFNNLTYPINSTSVAQTQGFLNFDIDVVTPHYGILKLDEVNFAYLPSTFTETSDGVTLTITNGLPDVDPSKENLTVVRPILQNMNSNLLQTNYLVQIGENQIAFSIPLNASYYPNPKSLNASGSRALENNPLAYSEGFDVSMDLGSMNVTATFRDLQLNQTVSQSTKIEIVDFIHVVWE